MRYGVADKYLKVVWTCLVFSRTMPLYCKARLLS